MNSSSSLRVSVAYCRSSEYEAAELGLQIAEMVLRVMPGGQAAVEAADGIDALEAPELRSHPQLEAAASQIIDQYFGEDYGL